MIVNPARIYNAFEPFSLGDDAREAIPQDDTEAINRKYSDFEFLELDVYSGTFQKWLNLVDDALIRKLIRRLYGLRLVNRPQDIPDIIYDEFMLVKRDYG